MQKNSFAGPLSDKPDRLKILSFDYQVGEKLSEENGNHPALNKGTNSARSSKDRNVAVV
jgi:hypothetical protein